MPRLADEIKQSRPFPSIEVEAALNLQRTAAIIEQATEATLKPHGISATQYNALRILQGAGSKGLSCQEVGARMIRPDADLTRLFDRLEARGLIRRTRSTLDRRVVVVAISSEGTQLLTSLAGVIEEFAKRILGRMGAPKLRLLIKLSEEARNFM